MGLVETGKVFKYFKKPGAAAVELSDDLEIGDVIVIKGATTDFEQKVESMQIEGEPIQKGREGQAVGIKVKERVRPNDMVYKKTED